MPLSYAVGEHFERFIKAQIETGRYASASEVSATHFVSWRNRSACASPRWTSSRRDPKGPRQRHRHARRGDLRAT